MSGRSRPIVYFYCNALPEAVRVRRRIDTDSPAATRKIMAMCKALRSAGVRAVVVSMARGPGRGGAFDQAGVTRVNGIPVVYGPLWHVPVLSQIISAMWLGLYARRRVGGRAAECRHLFYNQMSLYLPALYALTLRGASTLVDIEDGPLAAGRSSYRRVGTDASTAFARHVTNGAILATSRLAQGTSIRPVQTCYGAVPKPKAFKRERFDREPLGVMLAGFINGDTGQSVIEAALTRMRASNDPVFDSVAFEIAGAGPGIDTLRRFDGGVRPQVRVWGRLGADEYSEMLGRMHIGLSLKPVGGDVSETTFPSKTVEIAENGLALIATDISDVRAVFGPDAWYLESNDADELIDHIRRAAVDRASVARLAAAGQKRVSERLSYRVVGGELRAFLFGDTR